MRPAIVIAMVMLAFSLNSRPTLAQTGDEWRWLFSLKMFNGQTGWAVAFKGRFEPVSVVRTTDGGRHWKDVTPQAPPGLRLSPLGVGWLRARTPLGAWAQSSLEQLTPDGQPSSSPVVFHTLDGGQTWSVSISVRGWLMDFLNARDGWSVSGNDVLRSTDGGKTWFKIASGIASVHHPASLHFLSATRGWITGNVGETLPRRPYLLVTSDGGYTWKQQNLPVPPQLTLSDSELVAELPQLLTAQVGILPIRYETHKGAGVFFCVTRDGGTTWTYTTPLTLPSSPSRSGTVGLGYWGSSFADVNHGWVTDADALYVTSDGGRRWTKIQPRLPFDRPLGHLEFISPQVGWATGWHFDKPFLLKTLDGGRTWTSIPYVISR